LGRSATGKKKYVYIHNLNSVISIYIYIDIYRYNAKTILIL